ncbi:recombinase family protein [Bacillus sp. CGMCC 1.16541]|uniref:recombinase family protein n=1 Tax=Bacillus sp. CGMCC 1.16541 TaxID=2185143 RepID=UPI0013A5B61D|nr:recombinase family protein [Bacillus sp. CGMCC 1.16541]
MRCASYIRVSTDKEEQKSSIANQKNIFINYIQENNWSLHDFYIDVETGTTGNRENLQRLIQDAKNKNFDVIIAKELSRLARNGSLSYQIRDIAQQNRIGIITLDGAINSINGDVSKYGLYTWLYEEESQRTSERVKSSLKARAAKGLFKGAHPPYGYEIHNGKLFLRDDRSPEVVKWIYEQYISGRGFDAIAKELYVKGVTSPSTLAEKKNSSPKWHGSSVRFILENPHYTGNLVQQRETTLSVTNKVRVINPKEQMIIVPNTHEPLISEATFDLVQDLIRSRAKKRISSCKHLFSGIITCNDCGTAMHYKYNRKGYICGRYVKLSKKACTHHAVKETSIIEKILTDTKQCGELILNSDTSQRLLEINQREYKRLLKKLTTVKSKIESVQVRKSKLLTLLMEETISKLDYQHAVSSLDKEINALKTDEAHLQYILDKKDDIEEIENLKALLREISTASDITNLTVNKLIKSIRVKENGTPLIEYRFQTLNHLGEFLS